MEVDTLDQIDRMVNDRTAMLFFCKILEENGPVSLGEFAAKGKELGVPTLIDGSST